MLVVRGIGGRSSEGEEFRSARGLKVEDDELTERQGNDLIRCIYSNSSLLSIATSCLLVSTLPVLRIDTWLL